jgi:mono/diheme cytochrome c family protein
MSRRFWLARGPARFDHWSRVAGTMLLGCLALASIPSCTKHPARVIPTYPALPLSSAAAAKPYDNDDPLRLGGRLFDNPWRELRLDFVPDDPKTEAIDGKGGPIGNGSLPDDQGKPLRNEGHDYRLKNLLGLDLHGAAGISGKAYQNASCVLLPDLLKNTDSRELWIARLTHGEDAIPAYGSVLSTVQVAALADFLLAIRDGKLPQPDDVFTLDEHVPGFYRLNDGGDVARGQVLFDNKCKACHGADGTNIPLDGGKYSLGTFLRTRASTAWLKILVGNAGSSMGPQLDKNAPRAVLAQELRDIFAAVCDRGRYPRGKASEAEVANGDARCGAYLK